MADEVTTLTPYMDIIRKVGEEWREYWENTLIPSPDYATKGESGAASQFAWAPEYLSASPEAEMDYVARLQEELPPEAWEYLSKSMFWKEPEDIPQATEEDQAQTRSTVARLSERLKDV